MDHYYLNDVFIPCLELFPLTDENNDNDDDIDSSRNEPMIDWMDDCQVQENLFQIIPLTPEETRCDKDNHIKSEVKVFFEELGYICDEPEPIDPGRNYEAEYKQQQEKQKCNNPKHNRYRQCHVDLETIPTPFFSFRRGTLDSPGLSSTSSSFYHTDDDEDNITKSSTSHTTSRLSHLNQHHPHHRHHQPHHQFHSHSSKSTTPQSHFS